jgi:UDP-N-acetylglucosamine 2-epimerase (non-hydrolysing)
MQRLESVYEATRPAMVLVYGDVNSTLAAALVAAKMGLPAAHVEAGLRSRDRTMPEEINRVLTDRMADVLFAPSRHAVDNLLGEGVEPERIDFVGNVMIDTLVSMLELARACAPGNRSRGAPPTRGGARPGTPGPEPSSPALRGSLRQEPTELFAEPTMISPVVVSVPGRQPRMVQPPPVKLCRYT